MSQLFISGGQSIDISALTSVLPMNNLKQNDLEIKRKVEAKAMGSEVTYMTV